MINNKIKSIECARCNSNRTYGKLPVRNKRNVKTKKRKRNNAFDSSSDSGFDEIIIDRKTRKNLNNLNSLNKQKLKDTIKELQSIIEENDKYIIFLEQNDNQNKQKIFELKEEIKELKLRIKELKNILGNTPTKKKYNTPNVVDPYDRKRRYNTPNVVDPSDYDSRYYTTDTSFSSSRNNNTDSSFNPSRNNNTDSSVSNNSYDTNSYNTDSSDTDSSSDNNTFETVSKFLAKNDSSSNEKPEPSTKTESSSSEKPEPSLEPESSSSLNSLFNESSDNIEPIPKDLDKTEDLINELQSLRIENNKNINVNNFITHLLNKSNEEQKRKILALLNEKEVFEMLKY